MEPSKGIDTSLFRNRWRLRQPDTEVVACDFANPVVHRDRSAVLTGYRLRQMIPHSTTPAGGGCHD
ncbi:hypothetical protein ACWDSJ_09230 [Nocardia sp. NPDC003482]